jgi:hypothetical protein
MVKVCVLQADNRPTLNYLLLSKRVNIKWSDFLGYRYEFIEFDNNKYGNIHPATKKIYIINEFLQNSTDDILVFLDSDAWIQNGIKLRNIVDNLVNDSNKHGCFSRDPYLIINTFINSGSFIIKNNEYTKKMYNEIITTFSNDDSHANKWPYDQFYISNYIFQHKDDFNIFIPHILNTPLGKVLRHNWLKNQKMHNDLIKLIEMHVITDFTPFEFDKNYDKEEYPNKNNNGNTYLVNE